MMVIADLKEELEPHKDTTEFKTLMTQLNKDLAKKDKEVQQRKSKKHMRDTNDFCNGQVFKWQSQLGKTETLSTYSTPEKTVRMHPQLSNEQSRQTMKNRRLQDPREEYRAMTPRQREYDGGNTEYQGYTPYRNERRPQQNNRTPQNGGRKLYYGKNNRRPQNRNNWYRPPYEEREYRGPPYEYRDQRRPMQDYRDNRDQEYYRPRDRSPMQEYRYDNGRGPPQRNYRSDE